MESARTAEQYRFATLEQLMSFLRQQTAETVWQPTDVDGLPDGAKTPERGDPPPPNWRFSVEELGSGEQHQFTSLEALLAFLKRG